MQIAVMQPDVAALIANGQPLTLFGDLACFWRSGSLRSEPAGRKPLTSRTALMLEVTPAPHNGCRKFNARVRQTRLSLVSSRECGGSAIYVASTCGSSSAGAVRPGDSVSVLAPGDGGGVSEVRSVHATNP